MALSETLICNAALAKIGSKRINSLTDGSMEAIHCNTHYETTRDALLRSHLWRFALARAELSEDTETPAFEFDHQYILPSDCLRVIGVYDTENTYSLEGERLLTNDDEVDLWYIKKVTDPTKFDSLFVKVLALLLAIELVMPLSQDKTLKDRLELELRGVMSKARVVNLQETNTLGRDDMNLWVDARYGTGLATS